DVDRAEAVLHRLRCRLDVAGIRNVARQNQRLASERLHFVACGFEPFHAPCHQADLCPPARERLCRRPADTRRCPGYDHYLSLSAFHVESRLQSFTLAKTSAHTTRHVERLDDSV